MAVQYLGAILDHFDTKLATITSSASSAVFEAIDYRYPMDKQPEGAVQGKYALAATSPRTVRPQFGNGEVRRRAEVTVQHAYYQGGGDANQGTVRDVMPMALQDGQRMADVIEQPNENGYNRDVTGIVTINTLGTKFVRQAGSTSIWETTFEVEFRSDVYEVP